VQKAIFRKRGLSKEANSELRRRGRPRRKWMFPLGGLVRWKPQVGMRIITFFVPMTNAVCRQDGLFFLQLMKWGVLQYCVVRPTCVISFIFHSFTDNFDARTTLAAVILNHVGLYCEQSWSPAWGHIYVRDAFPLLSIWLPFKVVW
jgi:hypothetical protein